MADSIVIESVNKKLHLEFAYQVIIVEAGKPFRLKQEGDYLLPVGLSPEDEQAFRFYETFRKEIESKDAPDGPWIFNRALIEEVHLKNLDMRDAIFEKKYQRNLKFLKQYKEKHKLGDNFYRTWSDYFKFKMMEGRTFLFTKYDRFPAEYIDATLAAKDSLMDESLIFMKQYMFTLHNFSSLGLRKSTGLASVPIKPTAEYVIRNFSGRSRDYILSCLIRNHFGEKPFNEEIKEVIKLFNDESISPVFKEYVNSFQNYEIRNPQMYSLTTLEGQSMNLKEVFKKSKVNYVDVWASWCGPCIAEMRSSEILRKEYQDKGVQFIFISIDGNAYNWKKANKRLALNNSYLDHSSAFSKAFKIKEIPRYFIFDENGNVINASARRPSDGEIKKVFDELLEAK